VVINGVDDVPGADQLEGLFPFFALGVAVSSPGRFLPAALPFGVGAGVPPPALVGVMLYDEANFEATTCPHCPQNFAFSSNSARQFEH